MLNLFRYVGLRRLRAHPMRTFLTATGVALGVALYVAIAIINRSTLAQFRENVDATAGRTTLSVGAGESGFPEDRLEIIRKVPGVKHAVPMVENRAYFAGSGAGRNDGSQTIIVLGIDLLREQAVRTYKTSDQQVIDDPLVFLNQPDSIIVTHAFARERGLRIDDRFELATARGKKAFTVRGLLSPEGPAKAYGGSIAIMDIDGARFAFGKENRLDRVDVVTAPGEDVDAVASRISAALGGSYRVERPSERSEAMERMVASYQTMMTFFSTMALLVGLVLVANSVSISVAERRREIGTLRALGAERRGVLGLFLTEAAVMGALGALAGVGLGRLLARALVRMVTDSMSSQYLTTIQVKDLVFTPGQAAGAVALGAGASLAAAAWPSFRATLVRPLEAMKRDDLGEEAGSKGLFRLAPWAGGALLLWTYVTARLALAERWPWIDQFNLVASMAGCALVGPAAVAALARAANRLAGGPDRRDVIPRLARDNLLRNPRRTGSNVVSLMVGLILVIDIAVVNESFRTTVGSWIERVVHADLLVSSQGNLTTYRVQPVHEDLAREIEDVPGVRRGPDRGAYGLRFIHLRYEGQEVGLKAFDSFHPDEGYRTFDVRDRPAAEAGHELFSGEDVVLVSENFSRNFGKRTGDHVELQTPSGAVRFRVAGVMTDFASPIGVLYMNRAVYKRHWRDLLISVFGVEVEKGRDAQEVRRAIDARLAGSRNLMVVSNSELKADLDRVIDQSFSYTRAIELAALAVGLLGLLNTMLISVMERRRELGMLRAVGMTQGQLQRLIMSESVILGALGALVATALGAWGSWIWIGSSLSRVLGWMVDFHFPLRSVATTIAIGIFVALVAGLLPARRAAEIEIREALEYE